MNDHPPLKQIVLASASPRRLELLQGLGLEVIVAPSDYGEPAVPGLAPADLAALHAREKLAAALRHVPAGAAKVPVVAADTVVDLDGRPLGKPRDGAEAAEMLGLLSGREHLVHTAFALALPGEAAWIEESATTRVRFFELTAQDVADYVATGEPLDKAGAYGIQGRAAALVAAIDGDFYTVMGFPLARFIRALARSGFRLPTAKQTRTG
jgi:septum formation protein